MRLIDLTLRRVRRHRELQLRFDPRFTLIGGANESGKSTLAEALHKGLFLKATATGRGVEELRSRLHPGLPEVEIGFAAAGRQWRLRKRFAGAGGTCQLSHDGGLSLNGAEAEEQLAALLGVEGAVEGRRIAQLPLRWAHLWVRQGEAGANLLAAPPEAYDLPRLIEQLQHGRGAGSALESGLDRRVIERLQEQLDQLFTATGRVRAGSPLAQARQRLEQARGQHAAALALRDQLDASLEELRASEERLQAIERRQAPALEQLRRCHSERELRLAELRPLEEGQRQLQQQRLELQTLTRQRQELQQEQQELLQQSLERQRQLGETRQRIDTLQERCQELERQRASLGELRLLAQLLLDQLLLERDEAQRLEHQAAFEQLQSQAEALKTRLAALPAIGVTQLADLRQVQLELARAEARCQAQATQVELLAADRAVELDGEALAVGASARLLRSVDLQVGAGVRLRIGPGGGEAPQQAERQWQACAEALAQRLAALKLKDLEEAEAITQRRGALEAELQQLRQAAGAIPWARLQRDAGEQQQRRQRLALALRPHAARLEQLRSSAELPEGREALEHWRDALAASAEQLEGQRSDRLGQLEQLRRSAAEQDQRQRSGEQRLQQLLGSLAALEERLNQLHERHGDLDGIDRQLAEQERELVRRREALNALEQQISSAREAAGCADAADPGQLLSLLQAEKEALLTRRGQHQQAIQSLSAQDPAAAVEQAQAELEQAEAACRRLDLQGRALQHLLQHLEEARRQLSERYSQPLGDAVTRYLDCLACPGYRPGLDFEPSAGLSNLQLSQDGEGFRFEELSGGMREQLNGALRLAMAELLQPAYDGALPLLFDDAFTNSDPTRLGGLRRMLQLAIERGLQIVLLSCTPELYAPLVEGGGLQHQLES